MNVKKMKQFVEANGIVMMKADKTTPSPEIDKLLLILNNPTKQLPYYVIFAPGRANKVDPFGGPIYSPMEIIRRLEEAGATSSKVVTSASE